MPRKMFDVREANASRPMDSFLPLPLQAGLKPLLLRIEDGLRMGT